MSVIGTVDSLWRYPVKSMRGEELGEVFLGFAGVYGDRVFAIQSSAAPKGFPYLTAREQRKMLQYRPRFRNAAKAARPVNLAEAESLAPGATPVYADDADLMVDVETPAAATLAIDDPALLGELQDGKGDLALLRSERALTDCRPVSLISLQTVRQLGDETGKAIDHRAFRANIYLNLDGKGFAEDDLVGRSIQIGAKARVSILELDPRCVMITLDPDTGESRPEVLKQVAKGHNGKAGVYGAVLVEGVVRKGDEIQLLS